MSRRHSMIPTTITQVQLARFRKLTRLAKKREELRLQLLAALATGANVEEGELVLDYHVEDQNRLTAQKVIHALGLTVQQVQELRMAAPPTRVRYLSVHDQTTLEWSAPVRRIRRPELQTVQTGEEEQD